MRSLTRTGSEQSMCTARKWIDLCMKEHDCSQSLPASDNASVRKLCPKRLICVKLSDPDNENNIRLVSCTEPCDYVTLSYCWGAHSSPLWRTTAGNLAPRHAGFRLEALPTTLQEAVITTRRLGYEYIWIDALCIIQDSVEDWERESAEMGSIYQNSSVTIAATSSADADSQFLNERRITQAEQNHKVI